MYVICIPKVESVTHLSSLESVEEAVSLTPFFPPSSTVVVTRRVLSSWGRSGGAGEGSKLPSSLPSISCTETSAQV